MIKACQVTKFYKTQGVKKVVFKDLDLTLFQGERLALMGPNGAGKSTLLRILTGVERPNYGKVIRTSSISWPVGLSTGFVAQLSAKENVQFICRLYQYTKKKRQDAINYVKDFSDIGDYFDMPMSTYSSGMRARVAFSLSMAFDFDYYVVDEALSTGDANFRQKCEQTFNERIDSKGLIMVTHQCSHVRRYCRHGIYINEGKLSYFDNVEALIEHYEKQ